MSSQVWWKKFDQYQDADPFFAPTFLAHAGPEGPALVEVYQGGKTQAGWGLQPRKRKDGSVDPGFMKNYSQKRFFWKMPRYNFMHHDLPFAFIMRSLNMVCIDIDGKNGGLEHALKLGNLPPTLAETSKSGDGLHLFYLTEDTWDEQLGFAMYDDQIGFVPGVDIRATGCVYHYPQQRWNDLLPVQLPTHLDQLLRKKKEHKAARVAKLTLNTGDHMDTLLVHEDLKQDLARPIPEGKRNNTLFAIGQQMLEADVPGWEDLIYSRAMELDLPVEEANRLVSNIATYRD